MGYRRFIALNHIYRKYKNHFNGKQELKSAPKSLSGE